MSTDARGDEQKLFDWKKAGTYSWKAHFPLGMRDGTTATTLPQKQTTETKKS